MRVADMQTEEGFSGAVVEYAQLHGWRVAHFRKARTKNGWRTPVAGNGTGFPDLVLVREKELLFVELKSQNGVVEHEQKKWLAALTAAGAACAVWRPSDWLTIEAVLKK